MLLGKGQKGTSHCVCVDCEEDWPYESKLQRVIEAALETEGVDEMCIRDSPYHEHGHLHPGRNRYLPGLLLGGGDQYKLYWYCGRGAGEQLYPCPWEREPGHHFHYQ